jgi:hypothetical protein
MCGKPMLLDRPYPLTDETIARTIAESDVPSSSTSTPTGAARAK